jgi:hypothetical protein
MNTNQKNNINNIPIDILYSIKKREYKKYNYDDKEIFKLHLKFLKNIY